MRNVLFFVKEPGFRKGHSMYSVSQLSLVSQVTTWRVGTCHDGSRQLLSDAGRKGRHSFWIPHTGREGLDTPWEDRHTPGLRHGPRAVAVSQPQDSPMG